MILQKQYLKDLKDNFLPFWEGAIDTEYGGVFTCFTNDGKEKISDIKYIWSQGRFLWLGCNLLNKSNELSIKENSVWKEAVDKTYLFLKNNAVMNNNHIVYAVERDGTKIPNQMDISIFADCFYVLGMNAYAKYKNKGNIFNETLEFYRSLKERIVKKDFKSEPYPIPKGFRSHSVPMILLNVSEELYETAKILDHSSRIELYNDMKRNFHEIMNDFKDTNRIIEMLPVQPQDEQTLLARHVNPGHMLECVWFLLHSLNQLEMKDDKGYIEQFANMTEYALNIGWDAKYDGILRFVDIEGGEPKGEKRDELLETLIIETWDTKLWWPHSEALYTTLLLKQLTKDDKWDEWYKRIENYVFDTFPNEDKRIGEWIQIRDRKGEPSEKTVALPVKDPFHIIRNYLLILDLPGEE